MYPSHFLRSKVCKFSLGDKTRGVSHCGLAIYIKKYLKAKEELWKLKYFTMQKYNFQNIPLRKTKILQDIITFMITNLKFQHKPKLSSFKFNPHIKNRPIIIFT
jgi:hypothetical protein